MLSAASTNQKVSHGSISVDGEGEIILRFDQILAYVEGCTRDSSTLSNFDRSKDEMFFQNVDAGLVPNPSLKRNKIKSDTKIKHTHYVQREGSPMDDSTLITIAQHSPTDESFTVTIADNTFNMEEHVYQYPRHVTFVILVLRQLIEGRHASSGVGYQIKEDNVFAMSDKLTHLYLLLLKLVSVQ